MGTKRMLTTLGCALALFAAALAAYAQETAPAAAAPTTAERVAAIKASLAQSHQNLKQYQWLETTAVSLKGEQKSSTQNNCQYGADGKVVKTPVAAPAADDKKRGIKGKIIENKKEDMAEYVQSCVALVKTYIPPDPAKIQAAKDAGKVSVTVLEPGKRVKVDIKDYEKTGDDLGIEVDMATNQILGLSVASYLTDATDAVTLDVRMATLADGTGYPSTVTLDGKAKQVQVAITNSGHQKKAN